ncbi:RrF2 family transcriptional regulator [Rothia aerolata]|uniref:DNA-binding protein n=1 Tax=Rothia aerolata TaxID=1812262 RepID=A0A917IWJ0_9MICC|nr:Rrf2 family transcriptional regulator [Rothia aerolata]GGH65353.1 DNA-binding protein [Rothia aerolata]
MRLTAFSDVSLRIMMLLAGAEGEKLSTQTIANGVGTPYNHVAKSVAFLANHGWVSASRGRFGGVCLSEAGSAATVGQVLRATEGDIPMVECESHEGSCPLDQSCRLKGALAKAREAFFAVLDPVVISELPSQRQMGPVFVELGLGPLAQTKKLEHAQKLPQS